jgi:hypothetical protein
MATAGRLVADGICTWQCLGATGPCASIKGRRVKRNGEPLCRCPCRGTFHGAAVDLFVPGSEDYRPAPSRPADPTLFDGQRRDVLGDAAVPAKRRRQPVRRRPVHPRRTVAS